MNLKKMWREEDEERLKKLCVGGVPFNLVDMYDLMVIYSTKISNG